MDGEGALALSTLPWVNEDAIAAAHPRIFHYTNIANLEKILSSGGLLATHFSQTNDSDEFKALRELLAQAMYDHIMPFVWERVRRGDLQFDGDEAKFRKIAFDDARRSVDILATSAPTPPHITCFSSHDLAHQKQNGLLTMWRLYGGEGSGIALGFDTAKLVGLTESLRDRLAISAIYLDRVGYGPDDPQTQQRLAEAPNLVRIHERAFSMLFGEQSALTEAQTEDLLKFFVLSASTKHPDFVDEREIRLVVAPSIEIGRNGRAVIESPFEGRLVIPYLDALEEIMIGPSDMQDDLFASARSSLDATGLQRVHVVRSATPYRRPPALQPCAPASR